MEPEAHGKKGFITKQKFCGCNDNVTAKNTTILNKHQTLGIVVLITCFIPSQQHSLIPFLHFP